MSTYETILTLDPKIKTHVLLPITIIMLLVHILREMLTVLISPKPQLDKMETVRENQHLQRCIISTTNSWSCLSQSEWESKKSVLVDLYSKQANLNKILEETTSNDAKTNKKKSKDIDDTNEEFQNPFSQAGIHEFLWNGMKSNLLNYLPQPILLFYMSHLFRGYIVLKLPFALTSNFKSMFQSSISTPDLDVSYVTGISWYFVNLLGVEGLSKAIKSGLFGISSMFSNPETDFLVSISTRLKSGGRAITENQQKQPDFSGIGGFAKPKKDDVFRKQIEVVKNVKFNSCLVDIEKRFIDRCS